MKTMYVTIHRRISESFEKIKEIYIYTNLINIKLADILIIVIIIVNNYNRRPAWKYYNHTETTYDCSCGYFPISQNIFFMFFIDAIYRFTKTGYDHS